MKKISILVKPSSSKCNMRCTYCFYEDVAKHRLIKDYGFMSVETMHKLIEQALIFVDEGLIHFAFQGGEPTLIGLDFYLQFVNYVNQLKVNQHVTYSIQTNGTTLDTAWVSFFKEHHFLVGISIDGKATHHNHYRPYHNGKGTHEDILKRLNLLKDYGVETNVLSVVNNTFANNITENYAFYKENDISFMQFIPQINDIDTFKTNDTLDNEHYLDFLKTSFDLWVEDINQQKLTSIRYFDNMLLIYLGYEPESCDLKGICSIQNVIESDGSIYPCDFYVTDNYKLGNVLHQRFEEVHQTKTAKSFIDESLLRNDECYTCPWFRMCRTGCKRRRNELHKDIHCEVYKAFFTYADNTFKDLARRIEQGLIIK